MNAQALAQADSDFLDAFIENLDNAGAEFNPTFFDMPAEVQDYNTLPREAMCADIPVNVFWPELRFVTTPFIVFSNPLTLLCV